MKVRLALFVLGTLVPLIHRAGLALGLVKIRD